MPPGMVRVEGSEEGDLLPPPAPAPHSSAARRRNRMGACGQGSACVGKEPAVWYPAGP